MEFIAVPCILEHPVFCHLHSQLVATVEALLNRLKIGVRRSGLIAAISDRSNIMIAEQLIQESNLVFCCSSLGTLSPGTSFNVTGTTLPHCERFTINLAIGTSGRDIAFHINPRLTQKYIVRNCKIANEWGSEEVTSALPFRLKSDQHFSIQVLVTEAEYFFSVNGHHFASFCHRVPYTKVTCLQVYGDVQNIQVDQLAILQYPDRMTSGEGNWSMASTEIVRETDGDWISAWNGRYDLEMPFYGRLPHLKYGNRLHILGCVKTLPHSFYLNLQTGQNIWPHPIIAFHVNPRFKGIGGKHVITRNSWRDGKWDREERSEMTTDFMPSRAFHMCIACTDAGYLVYVNGKLIVTYNHRVEMELVDTVYIQGDIRLGRLVLEEKTPVQALPSTQELGAIRKDKKR